MPGPFWLHQEGSQPFPCGKQRHWAPGRSRNNFRAECRLMAAWETGCTKANWDILKHVQPQSKSNGGHCVRFPCWVIFNVPQRQQTDISLHTQSAFSNCSVVEHLAGNWVLFEHSAGNVVSPKWDFLLLSANRWKILRAWLVKVENPFAIYGWALDLPPQGRFHDSLSHAP